MAKKRSTKRTSKSGLASTLGKRGAAAFEEHKDDEVRLQGGGDLPAGIDNGIAQLTMCKFDKFSKGDHEGEYYFMAAGIVQLPKVVDGIPVQGQRTQIGPEPLCETEGRSRESIDDHLSWILNELRKLGVPTGDIGMEELEVVVEELQKSQPFFRFRTWQGEPTEDWPNPRVNHDWRGECDFSPEDDDGVEEVDQPDEEEETEEPPKKRRSKKKGRRRK